MDHSGKPRPTLIFHGGFDSSLEELFYFGAAAAVWRGYNCLTFDGPGQGAPMREQKLPFRCDWEAVLTPVVDYALTRPDVDGENLALMGMSLGGYLAARAAAFEHRVRATVLFDGVYDCHESFRGMLPKEAVAALDTGDTVKCEQIIRKAMVSNTNLRWGITQGVWCFGASSIVDFLTKTKPLTMQGVAGQIRCPCLVLEAEGDMFFRGQPQKIYDALQAPKTLFRFTSEDGAENHCQSGALAYLHEVVFNWLDETLDLHDGRRRVPALQDSAGQVANG